MRQTRDGLEVGGGGILVVSIDCVDFDDKASIVNSVAIQ